MMIVSLSKYLFSYREMTSSHGSVRRWDKSLVMVVKVLHPWPQLQKQHGTLPGAQVHQKGLCNLIHTNTNSNNYVTIILVHPIDLNCHIQYTITCLVFILPHSISWSLYILISLYSYPAVRFKHYQFHTLIHTNLTHDSNILCIHFYDNFSTIQIALTQISKNIQTKKSHKFHWVFTLLEFGATFLTLFNYVSHTKFQ